MAASTAFHAQHSAHTHLGSQLVVEAVGTRRDDLWRGVKLCVKLILASSSTTTLAAAPARRSIPSHTQSYTCRGAVANAPHHHTPSILAWMELTMSWSMGSTRKMPITGPSHHRKAAATTAKVSQYRRQLRASPGTMYELRRGGRQGWCLQGGARRLLRG